LTLLKVRKLSVSSIQTRTLLSLLICTQETSFG